MFNTQDVVWETNYVIYFWSQPHEREIHQTKWGFNEHLSFESVIMAYIWLNNPTWIYWHALKHIDRPTADTITSMPHLWHTDKLPLSHLLSDSIIVSSKESSEFIRPRIFSLKLHLMHNMWLIVKIYHTKVQKCKLFYPVLRVKGLKKSMKRDETWFELNSSYKGCIPSHSDPDEQC